MKLVITFLFFVLSLSLVVAEPNAETIANFAKWMQKENVKSKVNLEPFPGAGYGGVANVELKQNDTILAVPYSALISNNNIKKESFLKDFEEWTGKLSVEPTIAWLISESQNPNSPFKAYLDVLPSSHPNHPLSWSDEELAATTGTGLTNSVTRIKNALEVVFNHLTEKLVEPNRSRFPNWSMERFIWAFQTVNSRSWGITTDGEQDNVLVPLADMLNHKPGAGFGGLSFDKQYFTINATQDYAVGEQVFDNYGYKSNYDLISTYGFAIEDNAYDHMSLQFNIEPKSLVQNIVVQLLKSANANYGSIKIYKNQIPNTLIAIHRMTLMEYKDLEFVNDALQGKPISLVNEFKAIRASIAALQGVLNSYPTTLVQDRELMENSEEWNKLSTNFKNAVILRKTQKEMIIKNMLVLKKLWENILLSGELMNGVAVK